MKINHWLYGDITPSKIKRTKHGRFTSFTSRLKTLFRRLSLISGVLLFSYGLILTGQLFAPTQITFADRLIPVKDTSPSIILQKIAKCESGSSQFDKNGQVLINSSHDIGKYQINVQIWGKKASELGYNLANEHDNEAMALWLFEHYGTEPWHPSGKCWK